MKTGDLRKIAMAMLAAALWPALQVGAYSTSSWLGTSDSSWLNTANWSGGTIAPTGGTYNVRLELHSGSGQDLVYDAANGTTVYATTTAGGGTTPRSLVLYDGRMFITGGVFEGLGASGDALGVSPGATLVIDGGTFIRTNNASGAEVEMGVNASGNNGFLLVSNGTAIIRQILVGSFAGASGAVVAAGGTLEMAFITKGSGNGSFTFDGGLVRASTNHADWIGSGIITRIRNGGAIVDTAGFDVGIQRYLGNDTGATGGLTKIGSGALTLVAGANNTYAGDTVVNGGTIRLAAAQGIPDGAGKGNLSLAAGALLDLNGFAETVNGLSGSGVVDNVTGGGALLFTAGGNGGGGVFDGVLQNTSGTLSLAKIGAGSLSLGGGNSFDGTVSVSGGELVAANDLAFGSVSGGVTVASLARVVLSGGVTVAGESIAIAGAGNYSGSNPIDYTGALRARGGSNEWTGDVLLGSADARIGAESGSLRVSGVISDGGAGYVLAVRSLLASDGVILGGANTYGGRTRFLQGRLTLDGGDDRLPAGADLEVGAANTDGAVLDLNGYNQRVGALYTSGGTGHGITNSRTDQASVFTVGDATDRTYSGFVGGNLKVVKIGAGTLSLTGSLSPADVTVSNGALRINGPAGGSGLITVMSGATLGGTGTVGAVSLEGGASLAPGNSAGVLTVNGAMTLANGALLNFELAAPDPAGGNGGDFVAGVNGLTLDGTLNVTSAGFDFLGAAGGDSWKLIGYTGALVDNGLDLGTLPALDAGLSYEIQSTADSIYLAVIPEPASVGLLGFALAAVAWSRRRR